MKYTAFYAFAATMALAACSNEPNTAQEASSAAASASSMASSESVQAKPVEAGDFINAFQEIFGEQPGVRKAHAKGVCAAGEFIPSPEAMNHFDAALLSEKTIPVVYRFSLSGGNPAVPDNAPTAARGLAAQFNLPGGGNHMIASVHTPIFSAKNPENFLGLLKASIPGTDGKPDPEKVKAFRDAHPDTQLLPKWIAENPPPYSFNTARYHGIHTFFLTNKAGENTKIRWHLEPKDGVKGLSSEELAEKNDNFLNDRLAQRLSTGPVEFDWIVSLGEKEDSETDPTSMWPSERKKINIGTLRIVSSGGDSCANINFDPNILSRGFSASDDPILKIRSAAYAISLGKRLSGQ